jgi:hypothetical protein
MVLTGLLPPYCYKKERMNAIIRNEEIFMAAGLSVSVEILRLSS